MGHFAASAAAHTCWGAMARCWVDTAVRLATSLGFRYAWPTYLKGRRLFQSVCSDRRVGTLGSV